MLPRELGGVVDAQLKVYGTKNLRVMDLSVLPVQSAAHPMGVCRFLDFYVMRFELSLSRVAIMYGMAEQGTLICYTILNGRLTRANSCGHHQSEPTPVAGLSFRDVS